jgi:glucose-1-phosphate adenylyltransferase
MAAIPPQSGAAPGSRASATAAGAETFQRVPVESTVALILGGGKGTRLYPLTEQRSKPAVPLGGKYRLIDIPISNCINSSIRRIFVLTQYNSASLNRHVSMSYKFDAYTRGFVEVMAAEQTEQSSDWYQGTADAVRRQIRHFQRWRPSHYLILSGDQLYRMDFRELLAHHLSTRARITVSGVPVSREAARAFGIFRIDGSGWIREFAEKPSDDADISAFAVRPDLAARLGLDPDGAHYLASMGIYVFDADCLHELLADPVRADFGKHLLPHALAAHPVSAYLFSGYWEDIGTIRGFFAANLMLAQKYPPFDFYDAVAPIYTNARYLPPSKFYASRVRSSIVAEGCIVGDAVIEDSVIGLRSIIDRGVHMSRTVMMGADDYDDPAELGRFKARGLPPRGVGPGSVVRDAILDKNARIGERVKIENVKGLEAADGDGWAIRQGIVVVKRDAVLADGTVI